MENLVKKELVRVASNHKYGKNPELWREHKDELFSYFDIKTEDIEDEDLILCLFFTENIPVGIDLYEMLTRTDIFKEVDLLEDDYLDLDIAGFTVSLDIDMNGHLTHATMAITLQDGSFFTDTLLNDVICLEDIFLEKALEYIESKRESNLMHIELLIDQLVTDENVTEEDKEKFLKQLINKINNLGGERKNG